MYEKAKVLGYIKKDFASILKSRNLIKGKLKAPKAY